MSTSCKAAIQLSGESRLHKNHNRKLKENKQPNKKKKATDKCERAAS